MGVSHQEEGPNWAALVMTCGPHHFFDTAAMQTLSTSSHEVHLSFCLFFPLLRLRKEQDVRDFHT